MQKTLIKTADLGADWYANAWSDGSFTVRNSDLGQRIDLSAESAARFLQLWNEVAAEVAPSNVEG